jgi:phage/plasmid-associated DNA primase
VRISAYGEYVGACEGRAPREVVITLLNIAGCQPLKANASNGRDQIAADDARFRQARMFGASYDPGGIGHAAAELFLNIIGCDTISFGRKYKSKWISQLPTKVLITSNEVPNLRDASGVQPTRFIKLEFKQSFYGHEDIELRNKLSSELPGIANRCLAALRRLNERGRFIQPTAGRALEQAIENLTNPFAAFMHDVAAGRRQRRADDGQALCDLQTLVRG